jgi:hypothetical protein
MEAPSKRWPNAIFDTDDLEGLKQDFSSCENDILEFVEHHYEDGTAPNESPEMAALYIGNMAYENHGEDDYFIGVVNDIEGEKGRKLAKGYIGIQAIREADC